MSQSEAPRLRRLLNDSCPGVSITSNPCAEDRARSAPRVTDSRALESWHLGAGRCGCFQQQIGTRGRLRSAKGTVGWFVGFRGGVDLPDFLNEQPDVLHWKEGSSNLLRDAPSLTWSRDTHVSSGHCTANA
eukprot:3260851-Rhodomonas_salina.10